jgi:uncharacterized membrane protein
VKADRSDTAAAWKKALRRTPGGAVAVKAIVFVVGLLFILLGLALAALPGPLTIPPILVGLYVWSTEFAWAERLLDRAKRSAQEAWEKAKRRPVITGLLTLSGLVAIVVGVVLVNRYDLLDRLKSAVGLG